MRFKFLDLFAVFTFSFLPITSLSVIDADYLPVSGLMIFLPGLILVTCYVRKMPKDVLTILLALLYFVLITVLHDFRVLPTLEFLREFAPIAVGVGSYCFFRFAINRRNFTALVKTLLIVNAIILFYGLIEIASIIGLLPMEIKRSFSLFLTGSAVSRLQLVFPEASWAGMYLVFVFPFVLFFQDYLKKTTLVVMGALFLATFSIYAYIVFAFGSVGYCICLYWRTTRIYKWLLGFVVVAPAVMVFIPFLAQTFEESGLYGYQYTRIANLFSLASIEALVTLDGSFFIRLMYPIYGAIIGADSIFGVGFADYGSVFNSMLSDMPYGEAALSFAEVRGDVLTVTADPRAFFISFLAFGGFPGLLFLAFVMIFSIRGMNKIGDSKMRKFSTLLFIYCFFMCFQFGSMAFFYIWFSLAIPHCLRD